MNGLRDPAEMLLESNVQVVLGSVLLFPSLMPDHTKHLLVRYQLRYQVYRLFVALQEVDHHVVAEAHGLEHKVSEQAPYQGNPLTVSKKSEKRLAVQLGLKERPVLHRALLVVKCSVRTLH